MQSKVAPFAATSDPTYGRQGATVVEVSVAAPGAGPVEEADLRLVIEEDQASGTYIYKTINRRTGEVVQQLPREEVVRLRDAAAYAAGEVIRTKA
jgi:flagellar protein FlaG